MSDSHVDGISKADFNMAVWITNAAALSNRYLDMWAVEYPYLEKVRVWIGRQQADSLWIYFNDVYTILEFQT